MADLKNDIKNKEFKRCYLLFGAEQFLMNKAAKDLENTVIDQSAAAMNTDYFNSDADAGKIIDAAETLPFLSDRRIVVVKDSGFFKDGRKAETERLAAYIADIPENTCLIFVEKDVDKRNRLYKAVSKEGMAQEFNFKSENEVIGDIVKIFKREKIVCDTETAAYLVHSTGTSMERLEKEALKLIDYKGSGTSLSKEDIDAVCTKSLEAKIFDLTGAISQRNCAQAIRIFRGLVISGENMFGILALLERQFKLLYQCRIMLAQNKTQAEMVQSTGQKPYPIKLGCQQCRNFTEETLKNAIFECIQADSDIKNGKIKDETALELMVVKYSS